MPVYEYRCLKCGNDFSVFYKTISEKGKVKCGKCGSEDIKKKFSSFSSVSSRNEKNEGFPSCAAQGGCGMTSGSCPYN